MQRFVSIHVFISTLAVLAFAACGTDSSVGEELDAIDVTADTGEDISLLDSSGLPDVTSDASDADEHGIGTPCEEDADCTSDLCVPLGDDGEAGVCSDYCTGDDCPDGYSCLFVTNSGEDATRVCIPDSLCVDEDGDGFGVGPGCVADDCDDTTDAINLAADEVCDGVDNDCDDEVDELPVDVGRTCSTGFGGTCESGRTECSAGLLTCVPDRTLREEICNGEDDDCDGLVDEGETGDALRRSCYSGAAGTQGVGLCATGLETCVDGAYTSCTDEVVPAAELCDGLDNDCDGLADEELPDEGLSCMTDALGICSTGARACMDGAAVCVATNEARAETCNGLDDNCNGFTDDDPAGGALRRSCYSGPEGTAGVGVCMSGWETCSEGGYGGCVGEVLPASGEICDGLDNDCDGLADEDLPFEGLACSTGLEGICAAGTRTCLGGAAVCIQAEEATEESCNGLDDDCDGLEDEDADDSCDVPFGTGVCVSGACDTAACDEGYGNCNSIGLDGCETDIWSSLMACGACGRPCEIPGSVSMCDRGTCTFVECLPEYYDLDGDEATGCEYACSGDPTLEFDDPDFDGFDANCDGVDGLISASIFVAPSEFGGSDRNDGRSPTTPVRTLPRAFDVATGCIGCPILLAQGTYEAPESLPDGVSIYGGYSEDFRWHDPEAHPTTLEAVTVEGIRISDVINGISLDGLNIQGVDSTEFEPRGRSSYVLWLENVPDGGVVVSRSTLVAGDGADGPAGADGADGANGAAATGSGGAGSSCGARGGNGGAARTCGSRGDAGFPINRSGAPGATGSVGSGSPAGGGGGGGGAGNSCTSCGSSAPPGVGTPGGNGSAGGDGASSAGGGVGALSAGASGFMPGRGLDGITGLTGRGGGGGGGGGSYHYGGRCRGGSGRTSSSGGSGGGGGAGGCGGNGGSGGEGGGASIGIYLYAASVSVIDVLVLTGNGGDGGDAGDGGNGSSGGSGRGGFGGGSRGSRGGNGASGGRGGAGGGGAGGCGGPVAAIVAAGGSSADIVDLVVVPGDPGVAGRGGIGGASPLGAGGDGADGCEGGVHEVLEL